METTPELLQEIARLAAAGFDPREVAFILNIKPSDFIAAVKDEDSEISMAYFNGFYTSELSVRESILSLARSGSSPAHTMANKLFHDTRLNLRKQSYPGFDE